MNEDTFETRPGPTTATATAQLPDGALLLTLRLSPGAEHELAQGAMSVLRLPLPGPYPNELVVALYLADEDMDGTLDHARRIAQGLIDGRLQPGPCVPYHREENHP